MDKYQWQENYYQTVLGVLFIGLFVAAIFLALTGELWGNLSCIGAGMLWGVVTLGLLKAVGSFARTAVSRFVLTDEVIARQVIANVLSAKTWPFTQTEKGFRLDTVEIRVGTGAIGRSTIKGAYIAIGPYRGNHVLLIDSLKEKIDEAFMPRGLGQD